MAPGSFASLGVEMFRAKFFICFSMALFFGKAGAENKCSSVFSVPRAAIVKIRSSGSKIFKLKDGRYFKEESKLNSLEDQVFNDDRVGVLAYRLLRSFGCDKYIAKTEYVSTGLDLVIDGRKVHTRPGVLQEGRANIRTALEDHRLLKGAAPTQAKQIHFVLNDGDWPRHYANWKLIWTLLRQTDLNIENLAVSEGRLFVFDIGDAFNKDSLRCQFGVCSEQENFEYNFPGQPFDRVEHIPDLRKADDKLKQMIKSISGGSISSLRLRLGNDVEKYLKSPRGTLDESLRSVRDAARNLVPWLEQAPSPFMK